MKTSSSLFLAALLTSSALLLSAAAQTGSSGSAGSTGTSAGATSASTGTTGTTSATTGTSTTTSTSAGLPTAGSVNSGLPTATNPGTSPTTTSTLPAATTTTLPGATNTTIQTTTTNQLPTVSTGSLPTATDMPLPTSSTDTTLNRAQVSSDARVLNSSTTNVPSPTDTTRVSPGTPPLGPQPASIDVNSSIAPTAGAGVSTTTNAASPIPSASPTRGAADATLTPTGDLPNAATRPGEAPLLTNRVETVVVSTPPPAPLQEAQPPSPGAGQVWVPGHYTFAQSQWIWISGAWSTPPSTSARWVDGRYDAATHRWTEGHWDLNSGASVIP